MAFERSNPAWQLQQLSQRMGEWLEARLNRIQVSRPEGDLRDLPQISGQVWEVLFWTIVVGAVAWLVWKLMPIVERYWLQRQGRSDRLLGPGAVPVRSKAEWLKLAHQYQQQKQYSQACRSLYMAVLHHLNDRGVLTIEDSRTDGEYLRWVRTLAQPQPYYVLFKIHEQVCYGDRPASAETFQQCQQAYQEITTPSEPSTTSREVQF